MIMTPRRLLSIVCAALATGACGTTTASDATDIPLTSTPPAADTTRSADVPSRLAFRDVTIPAGTSLPLALIGSLASDTSTLEDAVSAELTGRIAIDGRDVLPAGTRLTGVVTEVDDSNRVKGRATIAFRFTSLHASGAQYDVQAAPSVHVAPGTKAEDAAKIGIGASAGAVIGGIIGGQTERQRELPSAAAPERASCWQPEDGKYASDRVRT